MIRLALLAETGGIFLKHSVVSTRVGDWGKPTDNAAGAYVRVTTLPLVSTPPIDFAVCLLEGTGGAPRPISVLSSR